MLPSKVENTFATSCQRSDTPFDLVEVQETLASLPIKLYRKRQYRGRIPQARSYLQECDPDDVALAALASKLQILIWSDDRDFETTHRDLPHREALEGARPLISAPRRVSLAPP